MNRTFRQIAGALENDVIFLYGTITIGAAGAVSTNSGKGTSTVVKESSAGQYTITLTEPVNSLLYANFTLLHSTDSAETVGTAFRLNSQAVSSSTPTLVLQCSDVATGADANPASGAVIYYCIHARNSSVT